MRSDEQIRQFGVLERGSEMAKENGDVTIEGPFKPITFSLVKPKPKRKGGGKRGHVKHSKNARKQKVNKALARQLLAKVERDAQIREVAQILKDLAAEGRIEKVGPDRYRANLATRMAARRDAAREAS